MTDQNKGDHWGDLASLLGAEAREEEVVQGDVQTGGEADRGVEESASYPHVVATEAKDVRPRSAAAPADWDALASSLGIAVSPDVAGSSVEDVPPETHDEEPESGTVSDEGEEPASAVSMTELAETMEQLSDRIKEAPFGLEHEPTLRIVQETVEVFLDSDRSEEPSSADSEEEAPSRTKSKRRRRRRSRPGDKPATSEGVEASVEETAELQQDEAEPSEAEPEERHRSKRRRPRRRRQKAESSDKTRPDDTSKDESDDMFDESESEQDSDSDKAGHRSIPVWQEAISIIVEKNLESREKKPDGGSSQKRSGRRSGRRGRG